MTEQRFQELQSLIVHVMVSEDREDWVLYEEAAELLTEVKFLRAIIADAQRHYEPPADIEWYRQNVCSDGTCPRCVSGTHCHPVHAKKVK